MSPTFEQLQAPPPPPVSVVPKKARGQAKEHFPSEPYLTDGTDTPTDTPHPVIVGDTINQPSKQASSKVMAASGATGFLGAVAAWLRARFDLEITLEDLAVFGPIVTFVAGYYIRDRVPPWAQDQLDRWLR